MVELPGRFTEGHSIVWLTEERTYAILIEMGAFYSIVGYTRAGIDYQVLIENDEFVFGEEAVDSTE